MYHSKEAKKFGIQNTDVEFRETIPFGIPRNLMLTLNEGGRYGSKNSGGFRTDEIPWTPYNISITLDGFILEQNVTELN
jgi:hypothetical protein